MDPKSDHVEDVLMDGVERLHVHAQAQHDHKPEHYDGDSEQEDDDDENDTEESVQLGFAEPYDGERALFSNPDWRDWDGGKIGGKPIWLDPQNLPTLESMSCPTCEEPLCFVLQIYCPLDAPAEAFHRALYVFCCRKPGCTAAGCVKVLRCQLPRSNRFYPHSPDKGGAPSVSSEALPTLCGLCGMRGEKVCAGCKAVKYCSRLHQKEHWKAGHRNRCKVMQQQSDAGGAAVADIRPAGPEKEMVVPRSIFPEMEIVIGDDGDDGTRKNTVEEKNRENETLLKKYSDVYVTDATDDDAKLGQKDLDEASGANHAVKDPQTIRFLTTISMSPQQVIRYARWEDGSSPLWVSSEGQPGPRDIPRCPHCRAERKFEFQIMPQLLHYLRVDSKAVMPGAPGQPCRIGALDWGTLAMYTCTKSCSSGAEGQHGGGYVEEFVWRQKPLD